MDHVYKVGDLARVTIRMEHWPPMVPNVGDIVKVTKVLGPEVVEIIHEGVLHNYHVKFLEPYDGPPHCSCPTTTLMTRGCTCGGI